MEHPNSASVFSMVAIIPINVGNVADINQITAVIYLSKLSGD